MNYVYQLKDLAGGISYYGTTINIIGRKYKHFKELKEGRFRYKKIQKSFSKNPLNVEFRILRKFEKREFAEVYEQSLIKNGNSCNSRKIWKPAQVVRQFNTESPNSIVRLEIWTKLKNVNALGGKYKVQTYFRSLLNNYARTIEIKEITKLLSL